MKLTHKHSSALGILLMLGAGIAACSAPPGKGTQGDGDGDGDTNNPDGGSVDKLPDGVEEIHLLPARIRRLTTAEYDAAVQSLLGTNQTFGADFPPDARQHGYTLNEAQRVDPILARGLDHAAIALAEEALGNIDVLAPCTEFSDVGRACAETFVDAFASEAYRRPLAPEEKQGLLGLYDAATSGEGADPSQSAEAIYADGIALVIRGVLQSPGFIYVTETGGADPVGSIQLTQYETASAISFLVAGAPPDAALMAAAAAGSLSDPAEREAQARRLIETPQGRARSIDVVRQWLGLDRILVTAKDSNIYPEFADLRDEMAQETINFVHGVLDYDGGSLSTFLTGVSEAAPPTLKSMYSGGPPRNGLLNQGAFLSVYAHAHETSPILRGVAVMRRVACADIHLPTNLDVEIVPPVPDPTLTTRDRFNVHTQNPDCATCHSLIDPIGFAFEQFDGMGAFRTMEGVNTIDSSGDISLGLDFDGSYASSTDFMSALAVSSHVAQCFARQIYRSHAGEASGIRESEQAFVDDWGGLEAAPGFVETVVAFVKSDTFTYRRNP